MSKCDKQIMTWQGCLPEFKRHLLHISRVRLWIHVIAVFYRLSGKVPDIDIVLASIFNTTIKFRTAFTEK